MAALGTKPWSRASLLFFQQRVPLLGQLVEFRLLLGNAPGCSFFVLRARRGRGLFDQLPDIVPKDRDAVVEFRCRKGIVVAHVRSWKWTGGPHAIANEGIDLVLSRLPLPALPGGAPPDAGRLRANSSGLSEI